MKRLVLLLAFASAPAVAETGFYLVEDLAAQSPQLPVRAQAQELSAIYRDLARVAGVDATLVYSNDPDINAFATEAGGERLVVVQEGLLAHFQGDRDAVAAVLGHELAHHKENHLTEGRRKQEGIRIFGAILGAVVGANVGDNHGALAGVASNVAVNAGAGLVALKFGRNQELEADRLTVEWMIRAGYNPRGMLRLQEHLGALQGKRKAGMLGTHPGSAKRYKAAEKQIAKSAPPDDLLAREVAPLVREETLAVAATQLADATRALMDAELAAFADANAATPPGAALAPAPADAAATSGVRIGGNVRVGNNVRIGGKPAATNDARGE